MTPEQAKVTRMFLDELLSKLYTVSRQLEADGMKEPRRFIIASPSKAGREALEATILRHFREVIGDRVIEYVKLEGSSNEHSHYRFPHHGLEIVVCDLEPPKEQSNQ